MQRASAYLRKNGYFVHSDSETTCEVWVAGPPFTKCPLDVPAEILSQAVRRALAASQQNIEHPKDWDAVEYPLPELAGEKSWGGFMKNARCVSIEKTDKDITFQPYKNCGPREGFVPNESPVVIPDESDPNRIATALAEAFSRCD